MKTESKNKVSNFTREVINEIAIDFIVNEKTKGEIIDKYNISLDSMNMIINRLNLVKKRDKYREKVLDKSLERCSTYQSKIIYKATELLSNHVESLSQKARKIELSSSEIRDVMAILQIISREHRLDNDKPTDRTVKKVEVSLPEGFSAITKKPDVIVDAEYKDVEDQKPKEPVSDDSDSEEIEVESDILENPLG